MVSFAAERPDNDEVVQRVQDERNPIGGRLERAAAAGSRKIYLASCPFAGVRCFKVIYRSRQTTGGPYEKVLTRIRCRAADIRVVVG